MVKYSRIIFCVCAKINNLPRVKDIKNDIYSFNLIENPDTQHTMSPTLLYILHYFFFKTANSDF